MSTQETARESDVSCCTVWLKKSPCGYLTFFPKLLRVFSPNFTCLLQVANYARLQIFIQLSATLTKLCHIKRDHLVHIIMFKMSTIGGNACWHFLTIFLNSLEFRVQILHTYYAILSQLSLNVTELCHIKCDQPAFVSGWSFLLLARYVPNVAKRNIWDQCKKKYILRTDRRPTNDRPHIWENFKWPYLLEGSSDPLHVWFYGGVLAVGGSSGAISGLNKFNRYVGKTMREE